MSVPQRTGPAIRPIGLQPAFLLGVDPVLDGDEYGRPIERCRARAEERAAAGPREIAA